MTLGQHQEKFASDLAKLIQYAISLGYGVRIGEVERPIMMQEFYVKTNRSKTMNSQHLKKCAADLHFTLKGVLCYPDNLGQYWESLDPINSWGGNWKSFKDKPHFERRA
jgi:hypothetical protein